ncbi:MAG: four helix bundle protein [Cyanobacteria bacterium P01_D01_bin.2]
MAIERFEQLEVWQEAHKLVLAVYRNTKELPSDERFGLISQMRRASISVPANIAEGFKRRGKGEKVRFYNIAQASLEELRYYFILCRDLEYPIEFDSLASSAERVGKMLNGLVRAVGGVG